MRGSASAPFETNSEGWLFLCDVVTLPQISRGIVFCIGTLEMHVDETHGIYLPPVMIGGSGWLWKAHIVARLLVIVVRLGSTGSGSGES